MDSLIRFRVATEDKAKFEAAAERAGQSLSDWIRTVLLDEVTEAAKRVVPLERIDIDSPIDPVMATRRADQVQRRVVGRPDPDKIAEFQRKAGMAGGKKRNG